MSYKTDISKIPAGGETPMRKILNFLKSKSTIGFLVSVAIMALISLAFFSPDAMQGHVLQQHDMQQGYANGHEIQAYKEATGIDSYWTNSLFSGMPTFQISPTYASNSLIRWVNTIYGLGLPSPSNLLFMMMFGFFILLIAMRVKWPLALVGAIAYGFSSYFIIIIGAGHIWKFITLAYIPPTIAGIVICYRGKMLLGAALTALFAMMQIDSNHPQMTYYFLFVIVGLAVAYFVIAMRRKKLAAWAKASAMLVVAAGLAVAANLPSLYNTLEYSKLTMRGGHSELTKPDADSNVTTKGLDKDYITAWSYGIDETVSLFIPNVKGGATIKPEHGQNKFLTLYDTPAGQRAVMSRSVDADAAMALAQFPQYFGDQPMTNGPVYVGVIIFALFILGCIILRGPLKWTLLVLTILSVLLSWGHNFMWLTDFMIDHFPMYNKFRTVASILVIAEFTMPLMAVLALKKVTESANPWRDYAKPFLWSFGATGALCLIGTLFPDFYGSYLSQQELSAYGKEIANYPQIFAGVENVRMSMVSSDALRSLLFAGLAGIALFFTLKGKMKPTAGIIAIGVLTLIDLYSVDKRYIDHNSFTSAPSASTAEMFPLRDVDRAILTDTAMNYRVADLPHMNEAWPSFHHRTIGGYHAAKLTRYQDILDNLSQQKCDMLNARYIIQDDTTAVVNPGAMGNAWLVDRINYVDGADAEMAAIDSLSLPDEAVADRQFATVLGASSPKAPGDTIFETTYAPDRLTYHVNSARGGVAVFSEVFFPWGWKAEIDGTPAEIGRVNYTLRALKVPAGSHTIAMRFEPDSIHSMVGVAKAAIIIIYLSLFAAVALSLISKQQPTDDNYEEI